MKKSKLYLFFFLFVFINLNLHAQYCDTTSFQKIFYNSGIKNASARNLFFNSLNNIFIIGSTESAIDKSEDIWIMKTTPGGNVIWSKTIGLQKDETINSVKNTSDGGFIIAGSTNSITTFDQGWVLKTDSNANINWSIIVGNQYSSLSQITQLSDGGYAMCGVSYTDFSGDSSGIITDVKKKTNLVVRIDQNGNTKWWRSFRYSNIEGLKTIIQLKDGNFLATGIAADNNDIYIIKINQLNGDILWMNQFTNTNKNSFPHAVEKSDGTIHLNIGNIIYYLNADGKFNDGKKIEINSSSFNLDNTPVTNVGTISAGTDMYYANLYPQHSPIVFAVKDDSIVVWAHQYEQTPDNLQRFSNGHFYNNSIYLAGNYVTDNLSDNSTGENLTYVIKADNSGSTLCSDTFNVSFKIKTIIYPADNTHSWINEGELQPQFILPVVHVADSKMKDDCGIQNCCKTILKDTLITMCANNSYRLPPNDSLVTTSGLYKFRYFTSFGGCDSILQYNVNFQQLFKFSLGNDTCLINNQPITFSLPTDSSIIYHWQNGSSATTFTVTTPGKYWVTSTSSCNIYRDTVNVNAVCMLPVYVPSAFTPNGDGLNDVFKLAELNGQRLISLLVYNRYGENIYSEKGLNKGWDGTYKGIPQPSGTYVYLIRYFDLQGIVHTLNGTIVLIR